MSSSKLSCGLLSRAASLSLSPSNRIISFSSPCPASISIHPSLPASTSCPLPHLLASSTISMELLKPSLLVFLLLLPHLFFRPLQVLASLADSSANESFEGFRSLTKGGTCNGRIGDCDLGSELLMDSEVSRRILDSTTGYISYDALTADKVPCSTAGSSYYNCGTSTAVNPYTRGCSTITLCARDTS